MRRNVSSLIGVVALALALSLLPARALAQSHGGHGGSMSGHGGGHIHGGHVGGFHGGHFHGGGFHGGHFHGGHFHGAHVHGWYPWGYGYGYYPYAYPYYTGYAPYQLVPVFVYFPFPHWEYRRVYPGYGYGY